MGQDYNDIHSILHPVNLASLLLDTAVSIYYDPRLIYPSLKDHVVHFRSGALGQIEVNDKTVFLNYIPKISH